MWTNWTAHWPKQRAARIRAVLGTTAIARSQPVRVMYQLADDDGNTRVEQAELQQVFDRGISVAAD